MTVSGSMEDVRMDVRYIRDYGMHTVEPLNPDDDPVTIASFPNWPETRNALASASLRGVILTPELATASENPLEWTTDPHRTHTHIEEARELSQGFPDATLVLGTPLHIWSNAEQRSRWLNGLVALKDGKELLWVFKQNPLPVETKVLGIDKPKTDPRRVLGENALVICNELIFHTHDRVKGGPGEPSKFVHKTDYPLKEERVRQVFAPSIWPIPNGLPSDWDPDKVNVGSDEYYRKHLELDVKLGVLAVMQSVDRVIVADRGRSGFPYPFTEDIAPYNAIFTRVPNSE